MGHTQVSGEKNWRLRVNPDPQAWGGAPPPHVTSADGRVGVLCRPGDMLFIDTGAWYHETSLPSCSYLSLSVAQDFFSKEEPPLDMISAQELVTVQLCPMCHTPTAPPPRCDESSSANGLP